MRFDGLPRSTDTGLYVAHSEKAGKPMIYLFQAVFDFNAVSVITCVCVCVLLVCVCYLCVCVFLV